MKRHETSSKKPFSDARRNKAVVYPFSAIVGQEEMKLSLLLNLIDPLIGGVLLMGHRGTGKSTIVRSLSALLPPIRVVSDCPFQCDPESLNDLCDDCKRRSEGPKPLKKGMRAVTVVDLPLGATEDMLCGSIDLHAALTGRPKVFEPGILARANRGILYVDEVNLLEDHLVDLLLDVAASGINIVEREGISVRHPARFFLIGSGNPQEGELRPQLLDRFGLHVEVETEQRIESRIEIVERREAFDRNPDAFCSAAEKDQKALRRRLQKARQLLPQIELSRQVLANVIQLCQELRVDGHRGELVISRGARALAAYEGRQEVSSKDVVRVAVMALRHRLRRDPLQSTPSGRRIEQELGKWFKDESETEIKDVGGSQKSSGHSDVNHLGRETSSAHSNGHRQNVPNGTSHDNHNSPLNLPARDADIQDQSGDFVKSRYSHLVSQPSGGRRGSSDAVNSRRGRYFTSNPKFEKGDRLAIGATLRAAAGRLQVDGGQHDVELTIRPSDLRYKKCRRPCRRLFVFLIDSSGSMAQNRIDYAKGAVGRLLRRSYVQRAYVALLSFYEGDAQIVLPPTRSIIRASNALNNIAVQGPTPLPAGLQRALELSRLPSRDGWEKTSLLIFTDGKANVSISKPDPLDMRDRNSIITSELRMLGGLLNAAGVETVVVDTQNRFVNTGAAQRLSENLSARYIQLQLGTTDTALSSLFE